MVVTYDWKGFFFANFIFGVETGDRSFLFFKLVSEVYSSLSFRRLLSCKMKESSLLLFLRRND